MNKFLKISTWKQIIQSRWLYFKNKDKDWFKERKEICNGCVYNSKFLDKKNFKSRLISLVNFKNDYCTVCKCPLKYKQSLPESNCGLEEILEEPKWKSIWK